MLEFLFWGYLGSIVISRMATGLAASIHAYKYGYNLASRSSSREARIGNILSEIRYNLVPIKNLIESFSLFIPSEANLNKLIDRGHLLATSESQVRGFESSVSLNEERSKSISDPVIDEPIKPIDKKEKPLNTILIPNVQRSSKIPERIEQLSKKKYPNLPKRPAEPTDYFDGPSKRMWKS